MRRNTSGARRMCVNLRMGRGRYQHSCVGRFGTRHDGTGDELDEIFACHAEEEVKQCRAFLLGEGCKRGPQDVVGDPMSCLKGLLAGWR